MIRTYCTCGVWHEFEGAVEPPKTIECSDCPVCNGDMKEGDDFEDYDFEKEHSEQRNQN